MLTTALQRCNAAPLWKQYNKHILMQPGPDENPLIQTGGCILLSNYQEVNFYYKGIEANIPNYRTQLSLFCKNN